MTDRFSHPTYLIRKKVLQIFGATFHIYGPAGQLVFFTKQKAFKLREDFRLFTREDMQTEVLTLKARQVLDLAATYDVYDSTSGEMVGSLRRKGLKSILKDEWILLDSQEREIGLIKEDSTLLALLRRFVTNLIPQSHRATVGDAPVATFKQNFNPFVTKITADFTPDVNGVLDRRLGVAAAVLLAAIEGKQQ